MTDSTRQSGKLSASALLLFSSNTQNHFSLTLKPKRNMMRLVLILLLAVCAQSFKLNRIMKQAAPKVTFPLDGDSLTAFIKAATATAVLIPFAASADSVDSTPVLVPLVVSVLTIVPFIIYQQALKPKPRTIKQVELDENLRPKDKNLNKGSVGKATAGKKK